MKEAKGDVPNWFVIVYFFPVVICIISLIYSMSYWQWHWFARSGVLLVISGIYLTGTQLIESGRRFKAMMKDFDRPEDAPIKPFYDDVPMRWISDYFGFWLLIAGTLVWGFGDLPSVLFSVKPH